MLPQTEAYYSMESRPRVRGCFKKTPAQSVEHANALRLTFLRRWATLRSLHTPVDSVDVDGGKDFAASLLSRNAELNVKPRIDRNNTEDAVTAYARSPGAWAKLRWGTCRLNTKLRQRRGRDIVSVQAIYGTGGHGLQNFCSAIAAQLEKQQFLEPYTGRALIDYTLRPGNELYWPTLDRISPETASYGPGEFVVTIRFFQSSYRQWSVDLAREFQLMRNERQLFSPLLPTDALLRKAANVFITRARARHLKLSSTSTSENFATTQTIIDLYTAQNGRCALSGIFLSVERSHKWVWSLDRIDDTLGYTLTNIRLVWLGLNLSTKMHPVDVDHVFPRQSTPQQTRKRSHSQVEDTDESDK